MLCFRAKQKQVPSLFQSYGIYLLPGQFINSGFNNQRLLEKLLVLKPIPISRSLGGYVVFTFDHHWNGSYCKDFVVYGNVFKGGDLNQELLKFLW
jgi:hypothetical protein